MQIMKCDCGLESKITSQMFVHREGDKINTRTAMVWECPVGHKDYRNYDDLK